MIGLIGQRESYMWLYLVAQEGLEMGILWLVEAEEWMQQMNLVAGRTRMNPDSVWNGQQLRWKFVVWDKTLSVLPCLSF